ncbi:LOW QUALITY PROTEIN: Carotenoid oxygenase [Trema orientale]|uniref:Carotenoid oxygenase n=1 Tax=Trema orientale TaxID=63057 RepID=A0A2P5FA20_TREOI|nr:LOW QUALITY PROTEIN: Carotenoid oxygenase [Trema orientale]
MAASSFGLQVKGPVHRDSNSISQGVKRHKLKPSLSLNVNKPFLKELRQLPSMKVEFYEAIKNTYEKMVDALADSIFKFVDQPLLLSQKNFVPVEEIGDTVEVTCSQGNIPSDFPPGVYIRNGPNPLFGGNKSTVSIFGQSSHTWVEGEGMVHAVYFKKLDDKLRHNWRISYKNRYVQSQTFKLEKQRNKPCFIPALEGDSTAIMAAYFVNMLRFGKVNKHMRNTNVIEHSGKIYVTAENHLPQEIDIHTLESSHEWDVDGAWDRTFTTHPKKAPNSGELVIMGVDAAKPYYVLGVIAADGKKLLHKVDLKFNRSVLLHDIGVSQKYNVIMDYPLVVDAKRLIKGGPLVKFEKEGYARIGVMPRYGDAESVQWFKIQNHCTFHIMNCFEEGNEVVVRGCRALESVLPGPETSMSGSQKGLDSLKIQVVVLVLVQKKAFSFLVHMNGGMLLTEVLSTMNLRNCEMWLVCERINETELKRHEIYSGSALKKMSLRPLFFTIFLENYKSFSKSQGESRENYRVEKIVK